VLAGNVGENDPAAYPCYQLAGLCNDIRRDGRLIAMVEFTSNIPRAHQPLAAFDSQGLREIETTFNGLCGWDFSHATIMRHDRLI
jgi:hypothetical protein